MGSQDGHGYDNVQKFQWNYTGFDDQNGPTTLHHAGMTMFKYGSDCGQWSI